MKITKSILTLITASVILSACSSDDSENTTPEKEIEDKDVVDYKSRPIDLNPDEWEMQSAFSDEFDNGIDLTKWDNEISNTSFIWTWETANVKTVDGNLSLNMTYEEHNDDRRTNISTNVLNNIDMFYKSGIIRSKGQITYGYFEARIKGTKTYPGACPAFWLYSVEDNSAIKDGVKYNEVDIIEMQQGEISSNGTRNSVSVIDCNLHAVVAKTGEADIQYRPNTTAGYSKNHKTMKFDPSEDFHTYGVEVREDWIIWYIDGKEEFRKENVNKIWSLPMHLTLSLGLRSPHVYYINGARFPSEKDATRTGFGPGEMEMQVDWVRTYTKKK